MSKIERDPAAVRDYERTLNEIVERQAVDEAENVLACAWIAELEAMRRKVLRLAVEARLAGNAARIQLRNAQALGESAELARAHARLTAIQARQEVNLEQAHSLLASVDSELEVICRAGIERSRRSQQDLRRLRIAWLAAFDTGEECG